jgi:hypothetical protein
MFDKIFALIKPELALTHMQSLTTTVVNLLAHFKDEFIIDPKSRDSAIDYLIELLKSQKSKK